MLIRLVKKHRSHLGLSSSISVHAAIETLLQKTSLKRVTLQGLYGSSYLYTWGIVSPLSLALAIRRDSYLSHGTAAGLHGLLDFPSPYVYTNKEQREKTTPLGQLTQDRIDQAFSRRQRTTGNIVRTGKWRLVLVNGKHTGRLGVIEARGEDGERQFVTNPERTLVDLVVRPAYAGGPAKVLAAFHSAREKVDGDTLVEMLHKLKYIYPYHQSLGFFMERAGFDEGAVGRLRRNLIFDFYVSHDIRQKAYDSSWKIHSPRTLDR
jgi:predicted transcriptional regulator of viral defense system